MKQLFLLFVLFIDFSSSAQELILYADSVYLVGFKNKVTDSVVIQARYDRVVPFKENRSLVYLNGKYGFVDRSGVAITEFKYDQARSFSEGRAAVCIDENWGYIDTTGVLVIPMNYYSVYDFKNGFAGVDTHDDKTGVIDKKGKQIVKPQLRYYYEGLENGYFRMLHDRQTILYNRRGKSVFKETYEIGDQYKNLLVVGQNQRYGVITTNEKTVIPLEYEYVRNDENGYFTLRLNCKMGLADSTGKVIIEPFYDDLYFTEKGLIGARIDEAYGKLDLNGEIVTPFKTYFDYSSSDIEVFEIEGLFGYRRKSDGVILVPALYEEADSVYDQYNHLIRVKKNGKYGFLECYNYKELTPMHFDEASPVCDNKARVKLDGNYYYLNDKGKIIVPSHNMFNKKAGVIDHAGKYGFIDPNGKELLPAVYNNINGDSEDFFVVLKDCKYGVVSPNGILITPIKYDYIYGNGELTELSFNNRYYGSKLCEVIIGHSSGVINAMGTEIIPPIYDEITSWIENGVIAVRLGNKWGYIDTNGHSFAGSIHYENIGGFLTNKLLSAKYNGKWGAVNQNGDVMIPFLYDYDFHFPNDNFGGYYPAAVAINGKWGYIDTLGQEVISFKYEEARAFIDGVAVVKRSNRILFITTNDSLVKELKYDDIRTDYQFYHLYPVQLNGKWGYAKQLGEEVIAPKYTSAGDFKNGFAIVELGNQFGVINEKGKMIIPFEYDRIEASGGYENYFYCSKNGKYCTLDSYGRFREPTEVEVQY